MPSEGPGKEWPEGPCHCSPALCSHLVSFLQVLFTQKNHFPKLPKTEGRPGKVALKTVPRSMCKPFYPRWEAAFLPLDGAASHVELIDLMFTLGKMIKLGANCCQNAAH